MEKTDRQCVIFCALPVSKSLCGLIRRDAFFIAADRGYQQMERLGLVPHLLIGDFDSSPQPIDFDAEMLVLPAEKDDTDSFYAIKQALARGFTDILLLGAAGGRADHTFANMQALLYIAQNGGRGQVAWEGGVCYCVAPSRPLVLWQTASWVSVFAAGGAAKGVTLRGLKYPLDRAVLTPDVPLGTSNEFAAPQAEIRCEEGYLYVLVEQRREAEEGTGL